MSALRGEKPQNEFFVVRILCLTVLLSSFAQAPRTFGREQTGGSVQVVLPPQQHPHSEAVAPLQDLLTEAEQNNPQIRAARQGWQSAKQIPSQVSTLPSMSEARDLSLDIQTATSPILASASLRTFPIQENCGLKAR